MMASLLKFFAALCVGICERMNDWCHLMFDIIIEASKIHIRHFVQSNQLWHHSTFYFLSLTISPLFDASANKHRIYKFIRVTKKKKNWQMLLFNFCTILPYAQA